MGTKYGMGTIYKRGGTFWIQYYRNGKPYRESSHSTKDADAKRLLKRRNEEVAEGRLPGLRFDKTTFDELKNDLITWYEVNGMKSLDRLKISFSHLEEMFKGLAINITTDKVNSYIKKRQDEKAANATINRELAALKQALNMGAKCTPPKVDRVIHITMLEENNVRTGFFEKGDFLSLCDKLPGYLKGFVTFAYHIPWRLTEIATLTWNQVDLVEGSVRLNPGQTKNKEGRIIFLDKEMEDLLTQQKAKRTKGGKVLPWVFLNEQGTDRIKRFDKAWKSACKNARIGNRLFHDLRRSGVRNMVNSGMPEVIAMQISGHKTPSVFHRYNIISPTQLREAAQRHGEYLRTQTATKTATVKEIGAAS